MEIKKIFAFYGLILLSCVLIIRKFLVVVTVYNNSMSPTLNNGDKLLVVKHWPGSLLKKGQIVIVSPDNRFKKNTKPFGVDFPYIKRVVALPGEYFSFSIEELHKPLIRYQDQTCDETGVKSLYIPKGYIFVCGDNSISSYDSRYWGPISYKSFLGLVTIKIPNR